MKIPAKCPKCGGKVSRGYGLAFGGMGEYVYCDSDACDFFDKEQDDEGSCATEPAVPA